MINLRYNIIIIRNIIVISLFVLLIINSVYNSFQIKSLENTLSVHKVLIKSLICEINANKAIETDSKEWEARLNFYSEHNLNIKANLGESLHALQQTARIEHKQWDETMPSDKENDIYEKWYKEEYHSKP